MAAATLPAPEPLHGRANFAEFMKWHRIGCSLETHCTSFNEDFDEPAGIELRRRASRRAARVVLSGVVPPV